MGSHPKVTYQPRRVTLDEGQPWKTRQGQAKSWVKCWVTRSFCGGQWCRSGNMSAMAQVSSQVGGGLSVGRGGDSRWGKHKLKAQDSPRSWPCSSLREESWSSEFLETNESHSMVWHVHVCVTYGSNRYGDSTVKTLQEFDKVLYILSSSRNIISTLWLYYPTIIILLTYFESLQ